METTAQIAKHFRDVHFGGNWTSVNLRESLEGVSWQQATKQLYCFNSIATLVFHMNYYVSAVLKVLRGEPLDAKDSSSFNLPAIQSKDNWENLLNKTWADAENFACLIEKLPDSRLDEIFAEEKYGTYYRNLQGITEHCHYHLGQIVLIKKMLLQAETAGN
jgi:hypothetical protein